MGHKRREEVNTGCGGLGNVQTPGHHRSILCLTVSTVKTKEGACSTWASLWHVASHASVQRRRFNIQGTPQRCVAPLYVTAMFNDQ